MSEGIPAPNPNAAGLSESIPQPGETDTSKPLASLPEWLDSSNSIHSLEHPPGAQPNRAQSTSAQAKSTHSAEKSTDRDRKLSPLQRRLQSLSITLLRISLLGLGSGLAWSFGVLVAHFNPGTPQPNLPLQERVSRYTHRTITKLGKLPQWWQQDGVVPIPTASVVLPDPQASPTPAQRPNQTALANLSPAKRSTLANQLTAVKTDLSALDTDMNVIETALGQPDQGRTLERRIEILEQLLAPEPTLYPQGAPSNSTASTLDDSANPNDISPTSSNRTAPKLPQMTLPSDVLFERNSSQLKVGAEAVLDAIVVDLLAYPGATIVIASYTDDAGDIRDNRELSFLRANTVERYFRDILGDEYRWVAVGYGEIQPLVDNANPVADQRNRRIEMTIDPR